MTRVGILSDAHGNLDALDAVLADMRAQGVETVLFLGDTFPEMGFPLEVVLRLRAMEHMHAVRGNRERHLLALDAENPSEWTSEQLAPLHYAYRVLGEAQRAWLKGLPDTRTIAFDGLPPVHMAHEPHWHLGTSSADLVTGMLYRRLKREGVPFCARTYAALARAEAARDVATMERLSRLPAGVYACGHFHVQWHMRAGDVLLVNPGSCGMPLDLRADAPYTILIGERGCWDVLERRVPYDVDAAAQKLRDSALYGEAEVFCRLTLAQLYTAEAALLPFLALAKEVAREWGRTASPFDNDVWREAGRRWFSDGD